VTNTHRLTDRQTDTRVEISADVPKYTKYYIIHAYHQIRSWFKYSAGAKD